VSKDWSFLTNHGHAYLCLAANPSWRLRDVAITERATQKIVAELVEAGYLSKERTGRRNEYQVIIGRPMRHAVEQHQPADTLLQLIGTRPPGVKP
jgi:hypothetical protein